MYIVYNVITGEVASVVETAMEAHDKCERYAAEDGLPHWGFYESDEITENVL